MSDPHPEYVSEEEAARLWQRAAQLQAEAAKRVEAAAHEGDRADPETPTPSDGYQLEHVRAAATEAGIAGEFVDAALADLQAERALPPQPRGATLSRRFLGDPPDAITVRRVIHASPQAVMVAMERLLPREPYRLTLTDRQGDPYDGGVLVFEISGAGFGVTEGFAGEASWADLRQVFVSLRPIADESSSCEVTLRGPVAWAHALNAGIGTVLTGMSGFLGTLLGSAGAGAVVSLGGFGVVAAALAAGAMSGGALLGGALGVKGFRALYRHGIGKGHRTLEGVLSAIAVEAEGGWGFAPPEQQVEEAPVPPALSP